MQDSKSHFFKHSQNKWYMYKQFLVDTSSLRNVWEMFLLFITFKFPGNIVFLRKLKLIYPSTPKHYNSCSAPTFSVLFKKLLTPPQFTKEGRDNAFSMRDYKGEAIKLLLFYMTIFYLQNCKVRTFKEN